MLLAFITAAITFTVLFALYFGHQRDTQTALLENIRETSTAGQESGTNFSTWDESVPYCEWDGVACNEDDPDLQIVEGLRLGNSSLHWSWTGRSLLTSPLIDNIRSLDLSNNKISKPAAVHGVRELDITDL